MKTSNRTLLLRALLVVSMAGYAHWFFGNLYERVVFYPNLQRGDTAETILSLRALFEFGSPTLYFVPVTIVALAATLGALAVG